MVAPAVDGIDLFKIAGRSISGWIPSLKTGTTIRQPFCSQLEERLLLRQVSDSAASWSYSPRSCSFCSHNREIFGNEVYAPPWKAMIGT